MSFPRREPIRISLELLNCIDQKGGKATRWDLIKILGNESQFNNWVKDFLMKDKFVEEIIESRHYFYRKTESGNLPPIVKKWRDNRGTIKGKWKKVAKLIVYRIPNASSMLSVE